MLVGKGDKEWFFAYLRFSGWDVTGCLKLFFRAVGVPISILPETIPCEWRSGLVEPSVSRSRHA